MKALDFWPPEEHHHCTRCKEPIKANRVNWLELNNWTNEYTDPDKAGFLPEEQSQGCFPFGADCAKRALAGEEW